MLCNVISNVFAKIVTVLVQKDKVKETMYIYKFHHKYLFVVTIKRNTIFFF